MKLVQLNYLRSILSFYFKRGKFFREVFTEKSIRELEKLLKDATPAKTHKFNAWLNEEDTQRYIDIICSQTLHANKNKLAYLVLFNNHDGMTNLNKMIYSLNKNDVLLNEILILFRKFDDGMLKRLFKYQEYISQLVPALLRLDFHMPDRRLIGKANGRNVYPQPAKFVVEAIDAIFSHPTIAMEIAISAEKEFFKYYSSGIRKPICDIVEHAQERIKLAEAFDLIFSSDNNLLRRHSFIGSNRPDVPEKKLPVVRRNSLSGMRLSGKGD